MVLRIMSYKRNTHGSNIYNGYTKNDVLYMHYVSTPSHQTYIVKIILTNLFGLLHFKIYVSYKQKVLYITKECKNRKAIILISESIRKLWNLVFSWWFDNYNHINHCAVDYHRYNLHTVIVTWLLSV